MNSHPVLLIQSLKMLNYHIFFIFISKKCSCIEGLNQLLQNVEFDSKTKHLGQLEDIMCFKKCEKRLHNCVFCVFRSRKLLLNFLNFLDKTFSFSLSLLQKLSGFVFAKKTWQAKFLWCVFAQGVWCVYMCVYVWMYVCMSVWKREKVVNIYVCVY